MISMTDLQLEFELLVTATANRQAHDMIMEMECSDFHNYNHQIIFEAYKKLAEDGEVADSITLRAKLIEMGKYDAVGGDKFYGEFVSSATVVNVLGTIKRLQNYAQRRKLYLLAHNIAGDVKNKTIDIDEIIQGVNTEIVNINSIRKSETISIAELCDGDVDSYSAAGKFHKTGFPDIDDKIMGLFKGELIIIGARTTTGKTSFALNIAKNIGTENNVLFISLEMSVNMLKMRLVQMESKIDSYKMRSGKLDNSERQMILDAEKKISNLKIKFATGCENINHIVSRIRNYANKDLPGIIIIDYLQMIKGVGNQNRYIQVGDISRALKLLSIELDVPIIALAQLNRAAEEGIPQLKDLRESGNIEQDADMIFLLFRKKEDDENIIRFVCGKNRCGIVVDTKLKYIKQTQNFYCLSNQNDNYDNTRSDIFG